MTGSVDHGPKVIWVNGERDGGIPGDDPGLLFGITAFETLRTYGKSRFA